MSNIVNCFDVTGGECSGHGKCIGNNNNSNPSQGEVSSCLCDDGWSSKCDFIETYNKQCPLNLLSIRILWGLNLLLIIFVMTESFEVFLFRTVNYLKLRKERGIGIQQNKGLFAVYIYVIISLPAHICLSILKLINPDLHVGFDILTSIFFFLGNVGFYASTSVYQTALFASTFKKEEIKKVQGLHLYNGIVWLSQMIGALVGFIPLALALERVNDVGTQQSFIISYFVLRSLSFLGNGLTTGIMVKQITVVLDKSAKTNEVNSSKLLELKAKFIDVQSSAFKIATLLGIFFLLCACWSYMWTKHDYMLPLVWIFMPFLQRKVVNAVNLDKSKLEGTKEAIKASALAKIKNLRRDPRGSNAISNKNATGEGSSSKGVNQGSRDTGLGNGSKIKMENNDSNNNNPSSTREARPNLVGSLVDIDEERDVVIIQNINNEFVPLPESTLKKELVDTPDIVLESLGETQEFESKTIITTSEIVVHESELLLSNYPFLRNIKLHFLLMVVYFIQLIFLFLMWRNMAPHELGYLTLILYPCTIAVVLSSLSPRVLKRLSFESNFLASSLLIGLLTIAAWDVLQWDPPRCISFLLLSGGAEIVLISDALFGNVQKFRFGLVVLAFLGTLTAFIFAQFIFISQFTDSIIVLMIPGVGKGAQFSVYNFFRDSLGGVCLLMFRVFFHEIRGKSKERFFSIADPVKVSYKSIEDEAFEMSRMKTAASRLGAKMMGRASLKLEKKKKPTVNVQSGFLVDESPANYNHEQKRAIFVYSDQIILRESDTFLVHWFGLEKGVKIIYLLTKKAHTRIFMIICLIIPNFVFYGFVLWGIFPPEVSIVGLIGLFPLIRSILTTSRSMFYLLTTRLDFWIDLSLLIIWFLATGYAFYFDARIAIFFVAGAVLLNAMLSDARILFGRNHALPPKSVSTTTSSKLYVSQNTESNDSNGGTESIKGRSTLYSKAKDMMKVNDSLHMSNLATIPSASQMAITKANEKFSKNKSKNARVAIVYRYILALMYLAYCAFPWIMILGIPYNIRILRAKPTLPGTASVFIDESDVIQSSFNLSISFSLMIFLRLLHATHARRKGELLDLRRPVKPKFIPNNPTTEEHIHASALSSKHQSNHAIDSKTINSHSISVKVDQRVPEPIVMIKEEETELSEKSQQHLTPAPTPTAATATTFNHNDQTDEMNTNDEVSTVKIDPITVDENKDNSSTVEANDGKEA